MNLTLNNHIEQVSLEMINQNMSCYLTILACVTYFVLCLCYYSKNMLKQDYPPKVIYFGIHQGFVFHTPY